MDAQYETLHYGGMLCASLRLEGDPKNLVPLHRPATHGLELEMGFRSLKTEVLVISGGKSSAPNGGPSLQ
jgi:hypothetical protein